MASELLELVIRGVLIGVVYGLIAMPITAIYVATDSVDIAIGGYAVLGGALAAVVGGATGVVVGILGGAAAAAVVGVVFVLLSRTGRFDPIGMVLASFGIATALSSLILWQWGKDPFVNRALTGSLSLGEIHVRLQGLLNLGLALAIVAMVSLLLYRTSIGRALRASAANVTAALLVGVPVLPLQFATFVAGGVIGATAGVLVYFTSGIDYASGLHLALVGLSAAVLVGMRRPLASFGGGVLIGVVQALATGYLSGAIASAIPMLVILVALLSGRLGTIDLAGDRP